MRFGIAAMLVLPVAAWRWHRRPASMREFAGAALLVPVMLIGIQTLAIWGTHCLPAGVARIARRIPFAATHRPGIGLTAQLVPMGKLLALAVSLTGIGTARHPSAIPLRAWVPSLS